MCICGCVCTCLCICAFCLFVHMCMFVFVCVCVCSLLLSCVFLAESDVFVSSSPFLRRPSPQGHKRCTQTQNIMPVPCVVHHADTVSYMYLYHVRVETALQKPNYNSRTVHDTAAIPRNFDCSMNTY